MSRKKADLRATDPCGMTTIEERQAIPSKSPSLAPARNLCHSSIENSLTGPSGLFLLPIMTASPRRATPTHAPLSQVREMRHEISPEAGVLSDMRILSYYYFRNDAG